MTREKHEEALRNIEAGKNGYAIAKVKSKRVWLDVSFHKGDSLVGTYYGGPQGLVGEALNDAMILSVARGRPLRMKGAHSSASPQTFYASDIERMITQRKRFGSDYKNEHNEAKILHILG